MSHLQNLKNFLVLVILQCQCFFGYNAISIMKFKAFLGLPNGVPFVILVSYGKKPLEILTWVLMTFSSNCYIGRHRDKVSIYLMRLTKTCWGTRLIGYRSCHSCCDNYGLGILLLQGYTISIMPWYDSVNTFSSILYNSYPLENDAQLFF